MIQKTASHMKIGEGWNKMSIAELAIKVELERLILHQSVRPPAQPDRINLRQLL